MSTVILHATPEVLSKDVASFAEFDAQSDDHQATNNYSDLKSTSNTTTSDVFSLEDAETPKKNYTSPIPQSLKVENDVLNLNSTEVPAENIVNLLSAIPKPIEIKSKSNNDVTDDGNVGLVLPMEESKKSPSEVTQEGIYTEVSSENKDSVTDFPTNSSNIAPDAIKIANISNQPPLDPQKAEVVRKKSSFSFSFGMKSSAPVAMSLEEVEAATNTRKAQLLENLDFLTRTRGVSEESVRCFIEREKGMMGMFPTFRLFLEAADGNPEKFLLSSTKNPMSKSAYFLISTDHSPGDRESNGTVGKLRGADDGAQFTLYDCGENPDKVKDPAMLRKELALIKFPKIPPGSPVAVSCWVPSTLPDGSTALWQPRQTAQGMEDAVSQGRIERLVRLSNKLDNPLDYKGRVSEASVKNFQLVSSETDNKTVMLFGKSQKERFVLDVGYPLSILQAFSIGIAVLDKTSNSTFKYK